MKKAIRGIFDAKFLFYIFIGIILVYVGGSYLGLSSQTWMNIPLFDYIQSSSNFVPFKTIQTYFTALVDGRSNVIIPVKGILGNLMVYLQSGFLLPFFLKKSNRLRRFMFSITSLLFIIEGIQLITRRSGFDIDEIILNILSAFIGYAIWKNRRVQRWIRKVGRMFK